jgi:hypothetical protein
MAVLSDPAGIAGKCGTRDDFLIASSCLNSTISGLLSRTFYRDDIIGKDDFHGAAFYSELSDRDVTYHFIDTVASYFDTADMELSQLPDIRDRAMAETEQVARRFGIEDINLVKPGIGEATRVLLRRMPFKVLVRSLKDEEHLGHLYRLASEKGVEVEEYPLSCYRACGIIKALADT